MKIFEKTQKSTKNRKGITIHSPNSIIFTNVTYRYPYNLSNTEYTACRKCGKTKKNCIKIQFKIFN